MAKTALDITGDEWLAYDMGKRYPDGRRPSIPRSRNAGSRRSNWLGMRRSGFTRISAPGGSFYSGPPSNGPHSRAGRMST